MELIENAADVCDVAALQHMGVRPDAVAKLVQPYTAVSIRGDTVWTIAYLFVRGPGVTDLCGHDLHAWFCALRPS